MPCTPFFLRREQMLMVLRGEEGPLPAPCPSPPLSSSQQDLPMTSVDKHFQRRPSAYRIKAPLPDSVQDASQSDLPQLPPGSLCYPPCFPLPWSLQPLPRVTLHSLAFPGTHSGPSLHHPGLPFLPLQAFSLWKVLVHSPKPCLRIPMKPCTSPGRSLLPSSVCPERFLMWPPQPAHV